VYILAISSGEVANCSKQLKMFSKHLVMSNSESADTVSYAMTLAEQWAFNDKL